MRGAGTELIAGNLAVVPYLRHAILQNGKNWLAFSRIAHKIAKSPAFVCGGELEGEPLEKLKPLGPDTRQISYISRLVMSIAPQL